MDRFAPVGRQAGAMTIMAWVGFAGTLAMTISVGFDGGLLRFAPVCRQAGAMTAMQDLNCGEDCFPDASGKQSSHCSFLLNGRHRERSEAIPL
jgi:hypothetical protein